jgi:RNA polymerase sigma factor (sigma-70 family)
MKGLSRTPATSPAATSDRTDALYRQHSRSVARICRALLRDNAEAEDATQQVFLSAHRALLRGAAPREPAAWLATIARNECWARIRARMSTPLATPDGSADRIAGPQNEAIERAELEALWQALADLPRTQRDAFLLREIRGLSYDQLAEHLALSHASVRSLLGRARQRLRLRLRDIHSSLGGAAWLETLARLFAGGGNPVAAKTVAAGLGAAALTGGAVVSPELLEHRAHPVIAPRPAVRTAPPIRTAPRVASPAVIPALPGPIEIRRVERGRREGEHSSRADARARSDDGDRGSGRSGKESGGAGKNISGDGGRSGDGGGSGGGDGSGESGHSGDD